MGVGGVLFFLFARAFWQVCVFSGMFPGALPGEGQWNWGAAEKKGRKRPEQT